MKSIVAFDLIRSLILERTDMSLANADIYPENFGNFIIGISTLDYKFEIICDRSFIYLSSSSNTDLVNAKINGVEGFTLDNIDQNLLLDKVVTILRKAELIA